MVRIRLSSSAESRTIERREKAGIVSLIRPRPPSHQNGRAAGD